MYIRGLRENHLVSYNDYDANDDDNDDDTDAGELLLRDSWPL